MGSRGSRSTIARTTVSPPTPESNTPTARGLLTGSPPQGLRDALLGAFELGGPGLGRQVFPSPVGKQAHDLGSLELGRDPLRDVDHGARGDAGEDRLLLGELAGGSERIRPGH